MPKVSFIMPAYNSESYIGKSIESILQQRYGDFELLIIDDASMDKTGKICEKYAVGDKRIQVVHKEKNGGISEARETGINLARGEWISFIDDDDLLAPYFLEELIKCIGEADVIGAEGLNLLSDKADRYSWTDDVFTEELMQFIEGKKACKMFFTGGSYIETLCRGNLWGKLIRKEFLFSALNITCSEKKRIPWLYMEDGLLVPIIFSKVSQIVFINKPMYIHRIYKKSTSNTLKTNAWFFDVISMYDVLLSFLKKNDDLESYQLCLRGAFLFCTSVWYRYDSNGNMAEYKVINGAVKCFFEKYYMDYKRSSRKTDIARISTDLFFTNRFLWKWTIGKMYFVVWYNLKHCTEK